MSYRRLPNTDRARLQALLNLHKMIEKDELNVLKDKVKQLKQLVNTFSLLLKQREELLETKKRLNSNKNQVQNILKLYNSHFLQVLNFSIERGELPKSVRGYFDLENNMGNLPDLKNEQLILSWADKIIIGEQKRVENGGEAISHPDIQKIKLIYLELKKYISQLKEVEKLGKNLQNKIQQQKIIVDGFIRQTWNEIEAKYSNEPIKIKQQKATKYGVVYVN